VGVEYLDSGAGGLSASTMTDSPVWATVWTAAASRTPGFRWKDSVVSDVDDDRPDPPVSDSRRGTPTGGETAIPSGLQQGPTPDESER